MFTSYRIAEMVRKHISNQYVTASDKDVASALGITRASVSAYKHGKAVMSSATAAKACQLIGIEGWEAGELLSRLMDEQSRTDAEHAVWKNIMRVCMAAKNKAAALVLAIVAAGTLSALPPNQAHASASADSDYTLYVLRCMRAAAASSAFPAKTAAPPGFSPGRSRPRAPLSCRRETRSASPCRGCRSAYACDC